MTLGVQTNQRADSGQSPEVDSGAVRALYPKLSIAGVDHRCNIISAPADGIDLGRLASQASLLEGNPRGGRHIVLAEKPRSELLSFSASLGGVICLREDVSSHFSIICRSNGVPVAVIEEAQFAELTARLGQDCAIDTLARDVMVGQISIDRSSHIQRRKQVLDRLDGQIGISISSNADTAEDISVAVASGFRKAWPRSETLLYAPDTLTTFRSLLFRPSDHLEEQFKISHAAAIANLMAAGKGSRLALRLLDPPAHEFLPHVDDRSAMLEIAERCGWTLDMVAARAKVLSEQNPMIGHRGCRLLLTHPSLLTAQVRSIFEAWSSLEASLRPPYLELFVPFVVTAREIGLVKRRIFDIANAYPDIDQSLIRFGAMIETPAIFDHAADVARLVDFVSYGTNDLAATYYALSRGDCYAQFLSDYVKLQLVECDPLFELSDALTSRIILFSKALRAAKPEIEIDVCGEHTLGANIWRAIRCGAFSSISVGVGNLPQLLDRMAEQGIIDADFAPTSSSISSVTVVA